MHREDDIAAYLLGALEEGEVASLRAHLDECRTCRAEYERLRAATDLLPLAVEQYQAPSAIGRRLMAEVRSEAEPGRWRPRWFGSSRGAALATALAAAAAVAVLAIAGVFSGGTAGQHTIRGQVRGTPGASVSLQVQGGRGELVLENMAPPAAGRIYEVWLQRAAGGPDPTDALFGVSHTGAAVVAVPGNLRGVRQVLVTSEPLGGSARPTRAPVIVVRVT
jgi:anti-sigma-K factor RskA